MAAMKKVQDDGRYKIVLDLGKLEFMSSKVWGSLIQA
jgi:anti-anti-sigma regulatory factor